MNNSKKSPLVCPCCNEQMELLEYLINGEQKSYILCSKCKYQRDISSTSIPKYESRPIKDWTSSFDVKKVFEDEIIKDFKRLLKEIERYES